MDLKLYSYLLLAFAGLVVLLWSANYPRRLRQHQYWLPLAALLYGIAAVSWYHTLWEPLVNLLLAVAMPLGLMWLPLTGDFPWLFNFLVLLIFALYKGTVSSLRKIMAWLRAWWARRRQAETRPEGEVASETVPAWSWAYEWHQERGVLLRQEWVFPGIVLLWLGGFLFLLLALCLVQVFHPLPFPLPQFPALALLLVLETAWYLGGIRPWEQPGQITGSDVITTKLADYQALWEEYQQVWPKRVLAAGQLTTPAVTPAPPPPPPLTGTAPLSEEIAAVSQTLRNQGVHLTPACQNMLSQLWQGHDVIVSEAWLRELAPLLLAFCRRVWLQGGRVAVLVATPGQQQAMTDWLQEQLQSGPGYLPLRRAVSYQDCLASRLWPDIFVITLNDLHTPTINQDFLEAEVQALLIVQANRTLGHHLGTVQPFLARLNEVLKRRTQYLIFTPDRYGLESALRRNICLDPDTREIKLSTQAAGRIFAILWQAEGEAWQQAILPAESAYYLGAEPVLATLAWREGIQNILWVPTDHLPAVHYLQRIDNHLGNLNGHPRLAGKLQGSAFQVMQRPALPCLTEALAQAVVIIRDEEYNLTKALWRWQNRTTEVALLLIVAPPYLLRDYLAQNAAYFLTQPLPALAPRIMKSRFAVAFTLLQRLLVVELRDEDIFPELKEIYPEAKNVPDQLSQLFREVFAIDLERLFLLQRRRTSHYDPRQEQFQEEIRWRLDARIMTQPGLAFLDRYTIRDSNQNILGSISADHLYQTYLPNQVHPINGRPYTIISADPATRLVNVEHCPDLKAEGSYRPDLRLTLHREYELFSAGHTRTRQRGPWRLHVSLCEGDFTIARQGYFYFPRGIDLRPEEFHYEKIYPEVVPPRTYRHGRLLTITVSRHDGQDIPRADAIAFTLAMLLNESLVTLFPETHRFVHATASLPADFFHNKDLEKFFPVLAISERQTVDPASAGATSEIHLVIVEDSQVDLGLVQGLFDDWQYVFLLLQDYLSWLLEEGSPQSQGGWQAAELPKDRFLKFGLADLPSEFNLVGTLELLRELAPYEAMTPCCQLRRQFYGTGDSGPSAEVPTSTHECDFCGKKLSGSELERLADGRERCRACQASAVNTVEALKQVWQEARTFLGQRFGLDLRRGLEVAFADAASVHQEAGTAFRPTPRHDARIVGVAVQHGKTSRISIENGAPYHQTLATLVHELTHIWQFDHLDMPRLEEDLGGMATEGLAVWAELACLTEKNLAPAYVQHLQDRQDEYGRAYRRFRQFLEIQGEAANPFALLARLYPKRSTP